MNMEDRELRCVSCGQAFVWTAGEQAYFADKQLPHEPRHCRACGRVRRSAGPVIPRPAARVTSEARCSQCGRPTTVPFQPSVGRPVFCRTCYQRRRSTTGRGND